VTANKAGVVGRARTASRSTGAFGLVSRGGRLNKTFGRRLGAREKGIPAG